jgi:puromycin-sensitive aminopeptidase
MNKNSKQAKSVRLSRNVLPTHYSLHIEPDLRKFTFEGNETIEITVAKPTDEIVLHAKELKVMSALVKQKNGEVISGKITFEKDAEMVRIKFPQRLDKGTWLLHIIFTGILNDQLHGFYRSRAVINGKEEYLGTTQFESTDARAAFPCFDEPDMKATFELTILAPKGMIAISNTPVAKTTKHAKGNLYRFAPTPKMSTYLLAFIVGRFEYIEKKIEGGTKVRVYTILGKKKQAQFALDTAAKSLAFYNNYFGIPYPLPMLQMIAIPDFSAGAMENWGAVTYRESALLIDPTNSSAANQQWVAVVIAHELAHQWFGNLVTMEWWTHLWLNEGFASYIEYVAVDHMFPEWDIWTQFVEHDLGSAMRLDALANTHAIEVEVHHPREISEIFDAVSYLKGASVIRMLAAYLGEHNFRAGLKKYLIRHKFGNAKTEDLWKAFEEVSKKPVARMMRNWTAQPGYPLLRVNDKNISQERFFSNATSMAKNTDKTIWHVPLGIEGRAGKDNGDIMTAKTFPLKNIPMGTKLNRGETGLIRVKYPSSWFPAFEGKIAAGEFAATDRVGLVRDTFALAEAGVSSVVDALGLLGSYRTDRDYTVWANCSTNIAHISNLIHDTPFREQYREFARHMFTDLAMYMGWEKRPNDSHTMTMLRNIAIGSFGGYGDPATIEEARRRFDDLVKKGIEVHPDIRSVVYGLTAKYGGAREHAELVKIYRAATSDQEKDRVGGALTSFRDPKLLEKTLTFAFSKDVRAQDAPSMVASVGMNPYGRELFWKFVQAKWPIIMKRYGDGGHMLPAFIRPLSGFHEASRIKEIKRFFKAHAAPGAERTIAQTLERIESNASWLKRDQKNIETFLKTTLLTT